MSYSVTPTLSVAAVHLRVTVVCDTDAVRFVGAVGGSVSTWHSGTWMVTVSLACERLSAASRALTYRPQVTPCGTVSEVDSVLPLTDLRNWPSWYTSYDVTPTLSVAASQEKVTELQVRSLTRGFGGMLGGVVSPPPLPAVPYTWSS